jgi:hypothetical protein
MTPFDEELKRALTRQEPSPGFSARVLARLPASKPAPNRWVHWRLAAAAAAILFLAGATAYQHERHLQGEAAKTKLLLAMRIAGSKLNQVQHLVQQSEESQ